ncbi:MULTISPECIES: hypothetical protein [Streptomyces]|uniref:hypothetical protein n=1 Tax=Streptomyces lycopersici TaxID=2974589 RepID=UPI0021D2AC74|nr:hypothetical protein [Streptomyces sp. NEAU-383]
MTATGLAMLTGQQPLRHTYAGWQHYRRTRRLFTPAPKLTLAQWRTMSEHQRSAHNMHRTATHVNLPLQDTPMALKVSRLVNRRLRNNALKQKSSTWPGVIVNGWGYQGKTETVCEVAASFEDDWLAMHHFLSPAAVEGALDLHAPVVYVQTPGHREVEEHLRDDPEFLRRPHQGHDPAPADQPGRPFPERPRRQGPDPR